MSVALHPYSQAQVARVTDLPIVHLTMGEGRSLVFLSQVAKPMSYLARGGADVTAAIIAPIGDFVRSAERARWRQQGKALDALGLKWTRLASLPVRMQRWAPNGAILSNCLDRFLGRRTPLILHCRGTAATRLALEVRGRFPLARIVSDCRGVDGPEQAESRGIVETPDPASADGRWVGALEHAQRQALSESDAILCVSEAMKRYLVDTWTLDEQAIGVVPCCFEGRQPLRGDNTVSLIRAQHGFEGKMVFAHVASDSAWQRADDVARLFARLVGRVSNAHFLLLSPNPQRMTDRLRACGLGEDRTIVLEAPHDRVGAYLAAADIGVLIRNHSLVSRVASPVKFAEYLSAGLPVVVTPAIGDCSDLVAKAGVGVVLPSIDIDEPAADAVANFVKGPGRGEDIRARAQEVAKRVFGWQSYLDVYRAAYARAAAA